MHNRDFIIDTAEKQISAWKSSMLKAVLEYVRIFNPLSVAIALEGERTWRHDYYAQYYRENVKITYDKTGYYVAFDNSLIRLFKQGNEIATQELKPHDKNNIIPTEIIEYSALNPTAKAAVDKVLPRYKGNRAKKSWDFLFPKSDWNRIRNDFAKDVSKILRAHYLSLNDAEGDDILYVATNYQKDKYESIIMVTRDSDMSQLLHQRNLVIYNHMDRNLTECQNPKDYLGVKILSGDTSDNIPGILIPGKKLKLGEAGAANLYEAIQGDCYNHAIETGYLNQYIRNRTLIDLSYIPSEVQRKICALIDESNPVLGAYEEILEMDITDKLRNEITAMQTLGFFALNNLDDIKNRPDKFNPERSEIRKFSDMDAQSPKVDNRFGDTSTYDQSGSSPMILPNVFG
jgi:5'-3' exonuclease